MNLSTKKKQILDTEIRVVVAKEWEWRGMDWEFWVSRCKLFYMYIYDKSR